ncbi:MAG: FAD-binding protein [Candidatus Zixiibacteriota bacterium]|nr:MAG: FAD-binding protein [candidate division Zixibacteria bacterium]
MMNSRAAEELSARLSRPELLVTDFSDYEAYLHDATNDRGKPGALVFAETEGDVAAAVDFCRAHSLALVPRGAGTGLSGGCVPAEGSLVLSTERMRRLTIDRESRTALCGPGVITKELLDKAAEFGLTYPPDPASYDESTLGGNVAENAGGLRCLRFGVTRDYVIGLRGVTVSGERMATGVLSKSKGFNLGDVLIGSEGTLLIITEIAVRLIPTPRVGDTILAAFGDPVDAARTVRDITRSGMVPTVLEYLDGDAAECSNKYEKTEGVERAAAILLVETPAENRQALTAAVRSFCRKNSCSHLRVESDENRVEQLWRIRRNLSNAVKEMATVRVSEDVAVPISKFPVLIDFVAEMNRTSPLRINAFGHAGDGNLHVNFLSMTGEDKDYQIMEQDIARLLKRTVELGGTLSGEHGVGLAKRRYLPLEFDGPTLDGMKRIKFIFDPQNLLNPGKIFPGP